MITGNTLLYLNKTYYFDDEGFECESYKEAKNESLSIEGITTIRKQKCYLKEFNELSKNEKEQVKAVLGFDSNLNPTELLYLFGASSDKLLLYNFWTNFQKDLDKGIYTII